MSPNFCDVVSDRQPHPALPSTPVALELNPEGVPDLGQLAEAFVAQWLLQQGWQILHRRWHCRWGELDLIASPPAGSLVFIEVKARRRGSWDEGGLLAITPKKQQKLWKAAAVFLTRHPQFANLPCRFDVALVHSRLLPQPPQRLTQPRVPAETPPPSTQQQKGRSLDQQLLIQTSQPIQPGTAIAIAGYQITLQHYISDAFVGEG